jgi:four helix bundle protein
MKITRFEDLECWQAARELTRIVYAATNGNSFRKDLRLGGQIRSSSGSVMANIAGSAP